MNNRSWSRSRINSLEYLLKKTSQHLQITLNTLKYNADNCTNFKTYFFQRNYGGNLNNTTRHISLYKVPGGNMATSRKTDFFHLEIAGKNHYLSWLLLRQITCLHRQEKKSLMKSQWVWRSKSCLKSLHGQRVLEMFPVNISLSHVYNWCCLWRHTNYILFHRHYKCPLVCSLFLVLQLLSKVL
jgi:hypothetical protein